MKAIVEKNSRGDHRGIKSIVYTESHLTGAVDDWFSKHKIWGLPFTCRTWNKLCKRVREVEIAAIAQVLNIPRDNIKYSRSAGCSCGCSPGYVVKNDQYFGRMIWVKFEDDEAEVQQIKSELPYYDGLLEKELARHQATSGAAV